MRALVIGPDEKQAISALIAKAEASAISYDEMQHHASSGRRGPPPILYELTVKLPMGFSATYSIEEHAPNVKCRHLSVGVRGAAGTAPSPHAVQALMTNFGFKNDLEICLNVGVVYTEPLFDRTVAINIIEPVSGQFADLPRSPPN